jgi:hypothetical protein
MTPAEIQHGSGSLREPWERYCEALREAGHLVLARSPANAIDRTEGLRYVTRLARMALKFCVEYADPAFPELVQYMDATQKFGVDNPDQLYLWARISEEHEYRLVGPRGTAAYVGIGVYGGSAGRGGRRTIAHVHADDLEIGPDGNLDVVLSTREHPGNWIRLEPDTTTLMVRQTMNDRRREAPGALRLVRLGSTGVPPLLTPERIAKGLERAARQIRASIVIFADLADRWAANPNVLHPSDTRMAEQSFGDPDLYYMGGYWRIAPDQALTIEFVPPACRYWSFLLCNYWTESLEYRYRPIWTNGHLARYRADGSVRIVVAHRDPGLSDATWIDTEGHGEGTMTLRWLLADQTPVPTPRLVRFEELRRG